MAIDLESHIAIMLQDPELQGPEREYLTRLREENARFLKENKGTLYPESPYSFDPEQVRSLADIRVGEAYILMERRDATQPFTKTCDIVFNNIRRKGSSGYRHVAHGPYRLGVRMLFVGHDSETWGSRDAWTMGLEPIPRSELTPEAQREIPANIPVWDPDSFLIRATPQTQGK